jgi:hypothetical protein
MKYNFHYENVISSIGKYEVNFSSHRIWTFYEIGTKCADCGASADFFAANKNDDGKKDHISTCTLKHQILRFCQQNIIIVPRMK